MVLAQLAGTASDVKLLAEGLFIGTEITGRPPKGLSKLNEMLAYIEIKQVRKIPDRRVHELDVLGEV